MPRSTIVSGIMTAAVIAVSLAACQRSAEPAPAPTAADTGAITPANETTPPPSAAPAAVTPEPMLPSPPLPEGTDVTYECQDGNQITVTYTYVAADLHWPDGREVKLSRTASTSKGGGDVYVGGKVSLQHDGGSIQLHDGGAAPVTCNESASSA